ncbi:hypothetical protein TRIUR3_00822 [Triticum urartu]|uniref:Ozone-responsive stress-related protein n=1 Tax=Triticum urartu TaxID=4572 RepID=M8ADF1_TRIUA|nr:hypothetical protein TRIUR3_00822 [Triticum urartu]
MSGKYIIGSLVGSLGIAYVCDAIVSDKKIFGGTVCKTATDKEWFQATDAKFQAWPRVARPPVVMNPTSTVCKTATDKEWFQATDAKFQAWPRVAGPPVVMNPISRQNFIVKDP